MGQVDVNKFLENMEKLSFPSLVTDIGSSLGGTLSATQALLNGAVQDPELRRDLLGGMDYELRYLRFLFENWILLQTIRTGKIRLAHHKINLPEWLPTILTPWQKIASEKNLQWNIHFAENLPEIYADSDRLAQAIGNLIYASILCSPPSSKIIVEVLLEGGVVKMSLYDSGPKINPLIILDDTLETVKQNFESHPRLSKGLGLGIMLAHRIVFAHKGEMKFEETENFNYCVSVNLPV